MFSFDELKSSKKRIFFSIVLGCILFAIGVVVGVKYSSSSGQQITFEAIREGREGYKFINPLLFTKTPEDLINTEYSELRNKVSLYTNEAISKESVSGVSVYFRHLDSGQWVAINSDETFNPASMLKVLTLITVMRAVESDPQFLKIPVVIEGDISMLVEDQTKYAAKDRIKSGNTYTVETLVEHLIVNSDNVAHAALIKLLGPERTQKTYDDLELTSPELAIGGYTAREYSHLFRALYNGTYLSRSLSERVLELLSKTSFNDGLVAGVPGGTLVSHKFGVKTTVTANSTPNNPIVSSREFHDCGIIYFPNQPYFLCVMTRGDDYSKLETVVKDVSKIVWSEVSKLQD